MNELSEAIKGLREEHGMSPKQFAEKVGCDFQSVLNWEGGACVPQDRCLERIDAEFGSEVMALKYKERAGDKESQKPGTAKTCPPRRAPRAPREEAKVEDPKRDISGLLSQIEEAGKVLRRLREMLE